MAELLTTREDSDGVAVLTLNRPDQRNALSKALREEIVARLDALESDSGVGAVVLTGAGPAFCAGFDRKEFAEADMVEVFAESTAYHRCVHRFAKPLVGAINGAALGGGCDLAALCDFRIASSIASFGQPQVRFGAPALYALMREVLGAGVAREMCLTGRRYDAREALAVGFVNRVVEPENLLAEASSVAASIASLPEGLPKQVKGSFLAVQPRLFEA